MSMQQQRPLLWNTATVVVQYIAYKMQAQRPPQAQRQRQASK